ncbi:acyl-CoA dehydrogenase family protein [Stenotrophobium rhamnosiphilum]|uniref:Acyl-CoA dehydrogenase n=1 Tax=Stenotrophobium rhamnosiphilum TaxID=2029166 RepID=A0A2T5MC24_9GAMM|nr:acyl-CoA dehydrogenase family protein [Stenotrophobium rhamnosiphilum]PTU30127.1 acyl-CoA dehydrogenase [Stenotrophobium rhamnosiphilum]
MSASNTYQRSDAESQLIELRDSARQVLSGLGLAVNEEKVWPIVTDLGWLLVGVPETLGGLEQGVTGSCAFHAELGRSLAAAPYAAATIAIDAICHSTLANQQSLIERFATGEIVTASLAESAVAIASNKVTGTMTAVPSADKASHVLVCVENSELVALLSLNQPGVEITARQTWDTTRRLFDVRFADVALDETLTLASGADAKTLSSRISTLRDFALAADAVGGAEALLEMTVEYLKTRKQFGRPLALFQALKHRCADLKMLISSAEALLNDSLSRVGNQLDGAQAVAMGKAAKYLACSVYARVAEESLQLHGGIGMTSEYPCHLYLKRALLNEHLGSGNYELDIADHFLS